MGNHESKWPFLRENISGNGNVGKGRRGIEQGRTMWPS